MRGILRPVVENCEFGGRAREIREKAVEPTEVLGRSSECSRMSYCRDAELKNEEMCPMFSSCDFGIRFQAPWKPFQNLLRIQKRRKRSVRFGIKIVYLQDNY